MDYKTFYNKNGYVVIPELLNTKEIEFYKKI